MRTILWSFKSHKFINIMKQVQILISVFVLFIAYGLLNDIYVKYTDSKNMFDKGTYIVDRSNYEYNIMNSGDTGKFLTNIKNIDECKVQGFYSSHMEGNIRFIEIDKELYNLLEIQMLKGEGFTEESFVKKRTVPIIISKDLNYQLNKELHINIADNEIDAIPIGVLNPKSKLWLHSKYLTEVLSNTIILPITSESDKLKSNLYVQFDSEKSMETFKENSNINLIENYRDGVKAYLDSKKEDIFYILFLAASLLTVLVIGISTFFTISTKNRYREIGIKFLLGGTKKSIGFEIIFEEFILLNIAMLIGGGFIKFLKPIIGVDAGLSFNINVAILVYFTILLNLIILNIVMIHIVKRLNPNNLIRGIK